VYKAIKRVFRHYQAFPKTPAAIHSKIVDLRERSEQDQQVMDKRHAEELMPILETIQNARNQAKELSLKHQKEKDDLVLGFATTELAILEGRITELPKEFKPIDSTPPVALTFFERLTDWLWPIYERILLVMNRTGQEKYVENESTNSSV